MPTANSSQHTQGPDIIKDHKGVFVMEKMMMTLKVIGNPTFFGGHGQHAVNCATTLRAGHAVARRSGAAHTQLNELLAS